MKKKRQINKINLILKKDRRMKQNRAGSLETKKNKDIEIIKNQWFVALNSVLGEFGPDPPLYPGCHVEGQFNLFFMQHEICPKFGWLS